MLPTCPADNSPNRWLSDTKGPGDVALPHSLLPESPDFTDAVVVKLRHPVGNPSRQNIGAGIGPVPAASSEPLGAGSAVMGVPYW